MYITIPTIQVEGPRVGSDEEIQMVGGDELEVLDALGNYTGNDGGSDVGNNIGMFYL
jgi:hypothetical protein